MPSLLDIINTKQIIRLHRAEKLEGYKQAIVVGRDVFLSPAMHSLALDQKADMAERNHLLKNIHCKIFGVVLSIPHKQKTEAFNG